MVIVDLFCGLGGWSEGFLAEGWQVIGFDNHRHVYGDQRYPSQLVLQDVLTIHGSQFRNAAGIVASPPCQKYSYMAMPWKNAKREISWQQWERDSPFGDFHLNDLFNACFRIQREASEAAGRHIPMVVENVKGAQPWVGRAKAHYGSFYLWGDVGMIGNRIVSSIDPVFGGPSIAALSRAQKFNPDGTRHGQGSWFAIADSKNRGSRTKNDGGSWFAVAHNTDSGHSQNPVNGVKVPSESGYRTEVGNGVRFTSRGCGVEGIKQPGHSGRKWFADPDVAGHLSSKSQERKAASAVIAKIPFELSRHIAILFKRKR